MSLVADYSSSSNDDTSSDEEAPKIFSRAKPQPSSEMKVKLPSANALLSSGKPGEVFNNPYKEAEDAEIAMLEKHVKMVKPEEHLKEKNGKKICWNYRKGRCRFGSNCTFAHDSDLQINPETDAIDQQQKTNITPNSTISKPQNGLQISTSTEKPAPADSKTTKKRPGLGDGIVPSKKVVKSYQNQKKAKYC